MTILKCDRFGKEINPDNAFIVETAPYHEYRICRPNHYDLCKDCEKILTDWITANRGMAE